MKFVVLNQIEQNCIKLEQESDSPVYEILTTPAGSNLNSLLFSWDTKKKKKLYCSYLKSYHKSRFICKTIFFSV